MSEYIEFTELIKRTKKLLSDYRGEFEASLLVNCSIGLLFTAKEKYGDLLYKVKDPLVIRNWGIDVDKITCCKRFNHKTKVLEDEPKTLRALCRHMRNAFAHCNFKPINNQRRIVGFKLYDYYVPKGNLQRAQKTFCFDIDLDKLKLFLNHVAEYIIQKEATVKHIKPR